MSPIEGLFCQHMSARSRVKVGEYQTRSGKRYVVDLRKDGGKRVAFKKKSDAEEWAEEKEKELNEHGRRAFLLTDADKLELFAAKEKLEPLGASITEAVAFFCSHRVTQSPRTVSSAIDELLAAKGRANCSKEYLDHMTCILGSFAVKFGDRLCHDVTQSFVEDWLNGANWQATTRKYNLKDLNTLFNFAMKHGWTKLNPCKNIEPIKIKEFAKGILAPDQAEILLLTCESVDPDLLRYFSDQLFGGLREDEAANLKANQSEPTFVHLTETKTDADRFNEYNDTWLRWRQGVHAPIVNLRKRADAVKQYAFNEMVAMELVTPDWWYPANCLRHSFCTYFAPVFGAEKTARLAGHSEKMQKTHYKRPVPLATAVSYLEI